MPCRSPSRIFLLSWLRRNTPSHTLTDVMNCCSAVRRSTRKKSTNFCWIFVPYLTSEPHRLPSRRRSNPPHTAAPEEGSLFRGFFRIEKNFIDVNRRKLYNFTVDTSPASAYNTGNQAKPMSKRSSRSGNLSASRGRCKRGRRSSGEWTCEGSANGFGSVVSDGIRTRYPGGAYEVRGLSGRIAPTWVVPQDESLVPKRDGAFYFLSWRSYDEAKYETMAALPAVF